MKIKSLSMDKRGKGKPINPILMFAIGVVVLGLILQFANVVDFTSYLKGDTKPLSVGGTDKTDGGDVVISTYQPTASYATQDKYSTTSISGTSYYKKSTNPATTTAISNVASGTSYTYWVANSTYWVKPVTFVATSTNDIVNKMAWVNGTATVTLYDITGKTAVTSGTSGNATLSANGQANIEVTFQGTAKASSSPFGGLMVVEYNNTLTSVTCTGSGVSTNSGKFGLTYSPTATTHVYSVFEYDSTLDDGTGSVKTINCQFQNGAVATAGSSYYVKFIPANYYVTQSGDIVLDTQKTADSTNTRTGSVINTPQVTGYWA